MKTITLYFVGFYKHGGIQCLLDGPFVSFDRAEYARGLNGDARAKVVEAELDTTRLFIWEDE